VARYYLNRYAPLWRGRPGQEMAAGFPVVVNGVPIRTLEALFGSLLDEIMLAVSNDLDCDATPRTALQNFDEPVKALQEMRRVLKPGAPNHWGPLCPRQ
jgi:hypothetical protein